MSYPRERETGIWGTRDWEQLKDAADRNRKSRPGKKMSRSLCLAGYQWMCKTGCLHLDGWRWIESRTLVRDRDPGQTSTLSYLLQCISLRWLDASNQKHHHWLERKKDVKKEQLILDSFVRSHVFHRRLVLFAFRILNLPTPPIWWLQLAYDVITSHHQISNWNVPANQLANGCLLHLFRSIRYLYSWQIKDKLPINKFFLIWVARRTGTLIFYSSSFRCSVVVILE